MDFVKRTTRRHRRARREAGMAYVEMLFVLPVLLILVAGLVDFTVMLHDWMIASHAAKTAARAASMFDHQCNSADKVAAGVDAAASFLGAGGGDEPLLQSSWSEDQIQVTRLDGASDFCQSGVISATVEVTYQYNFLRFVPGGVGGVSPTPPTMTGVATAMNENDF
jgi:Flp pilus assembly protein TadG